MVKTLALLSMSLATLAMAQDGYVEMNCVIDDGGEIWINGEQIIRPKKAGNPDQDTTSFMIPIMQGNNALAIRCTDHGWTGGICASIDLVPVGTADTIRSTVDYFKSMDFLATGDGGGTISTVGYDDTEWFAPGDYGYLADDTGGAPKPFFARMSAEAANLYSHKARWLWHPKRIYIRRSFSARSTSGTATVAIRGRGYSFSAYLNGNLLDSVGTMVPTNALYTYADQPINYGAENVMAISAFCLDSIDFSHLKAAVEWGSGAVRSDENWKYSWIEEPGWNDAGFDDSHWTNVGLKEAFDNTPDLLVVAYWIWATDMWLRAEFNVPTVSTLPSARGVADDAAAVTTSYYTLSGRRIADKQLLSMQGKLLLQRTLLCNGQSVVKMVRAGR